MRSCSRSARKRSATVSQDGKALDKSDYVVGAAFVNNVAGWEKNCGRVEHVDGIDDDDDTLFYLIEEVAEDDHKASLKMSIISGSEVAREVEVAISDHPVSATPGPPRVVLHSAELPRDPLLRTSVSGDQTLAIVSRPAVHFSRRANLFGRAHMDISGSTGADVWGIRMSFRRRFRFKPSVTWHHRIMANAGASLTVLRDLETSGSGMIFKKPIPGLGWKFRIWFVGRVNVGSHARLNYVLEAHVGAGLRASFGVSHETRQKVTANLRPLGLSMHNLPSAGTHADAHIAFSRMDGFAGVRPAIGLGVTRGDWNAEANIGAKVGVKAEIKSHYPTLLPIAHTTTRLIGPCNQCHFLRCDLYIQGKDLTGRIYVKGTLVKEKNIVDELFEWRIATFCAIPGR